MGQLCEEEVLLPHRRSLSLSLEPDIMDIGLRADKVLSIT